MPKIPTRFDCRYLLFRSRGLTQQRVDVLQSSRHVRVEVKGVEVANTSKPRFLYETLLPVRTYIPKTDCRLDLFEESALQTQCPYKVGFLPLSSNLQRL